MKQLKYLQYASETLVKHLETLEKTIANICNIQIKHLQHAYEIYATYR
jgi:hypothetical protein